MSQNITVTEHFLEANRVQLADILESIDNLHSAVSEGETYDFTGMSEAEVINHLRDIIYTAQETLIELDAQRAIRLNARPQRPVLQILPKVNRAG